MSDITLLLLGLSPTMLVFLYFLGFEFVGKPLATYGWRFWTEEPRIAPTLWSYLLYPMAHTRLDGIPFSQDLHVLKAIRNIESFPKLTPPIAKYLYAWHDGPHPRFDTLVYGPSDAHKQHYIGDAAMLWLPRLALLAFVLHPYALLRRAYVGMRWVMHSGLLKAVVGSINH